MTDPAAPQIPAPTPAGQPSVYGSAVVAYAQAGWPCIIPVPVADKFPPPTGFTGEHGRDTTPLDLVEFATGRGHDSIALRMPEGVIGIDVDQYAKAGKQKHGAHTLAELEKLYGPLPPTWACTARGIDSGPEAGPGASRTLFFRVPPQRYITKLTAAHLDEALGEEVITGDIEIIQRHHRYAVVAPSTNAQAMHADGYVPLYRWYRPDGTPAALGDETTGMPLEVPSPLDLAELPQAWVDALAEGASMAGPASADHASGQALLDQLLADDRIECAQITGAKYAALDELLRADAGSRHDTMTARVHALVQLAAQGHTGVGWALSQLRDEWAKLTAGEDRGAEFERMLLSSARKAVTLVGTVQPYRDPCLFEDGFMVLGAAPGDDRPGEAGPDGTLAEAAGVAQPQVWSIREVIGTHAFDPLAQLDQPLAQKVLERTYPVVRYAYDSRGWLLRVPDRWELHGNLTEWAVAQVAGLLPIGNPEAEKGSDEHARAERRKRFNTQAGSKAIANKMQALVAGGTHPCAVRLSDLDSDPEILWAGGLPWDLRKCLPDAPIETWVADPWRADPSTPHLQTAAVGPAHVPTPLWDVFLEAVFPDADVRAWAMRVLAIALTGYADRALPILLGDPGRGKTQLITLLMSVLGGYAHAADPRLLGAEGAKAHQSIVFALKGRRLSFIDEGPREGRFATERLKQLTGGGELTANQMNQNPITFRPSHTLVLTANEVPVLTDSAIRARARLIPCEGDPEQVRAARAAIGHVSGAAWRTEAPGVLARLMSEAAAWLAEPTSAATEAAPERIRFTAEEEAAEQDPVRTWVEDECEPFEAGTRSRELYGQFVASCLQANMRRDVIPSEQAWGRALTRLGFPTVRDMKSKRRQLRVRQGGSGWSVPQATSPEHAGSMPVNAGYMPVSETEPACAFPQVNPRFPDDHAGYAGNTRGLTHMRAHDARTHTRTRADDNSADIRHNTPTDEGEKAGLTCGNTAMPDMGEPASAPAEGLLEAIKAQSQPPATPKAPRKAPAQTTEEKRAARALAAEAKRQAAIAEAQGELFELPAMLTRDGVVRHVDLEATRHLLSGLSEVTVDVEHSGYPVGHEHYRLRTVQLGNETFAFVLDPTDAGQAAVIREVMAGAAVLHAHSATADLVPLAYDGLSDHEDTWRRMHDTVIPAKLADPASTGADPSLKKLAPAVLGDAALSPAAEEGRKALFKAGKWLTDTEATTEPERSGWAQVDSRSETMIRYAGSDVLDDAALAHRLPPVAPDLLERERTAQRLTARVAFHGVRLDGEHVNELLAEHRPKLADAGERLRGFGVENPGSDQQVAAVAERLGAVLPRTPKGKASVAKGALEPYRELNGDLGEFVRARLDYQKAETRLGLFLEPYQQLVERGDGRARPTVYTLSADTGRMSCVRPNLQQLPREGGFRACITADPGFAIVSADFSGVELRVAAALSQDPNLIRMLAEGIDLHWEAARQVFGPQATKAQRYKVKSGNFGWLYGGRAPTLSAQMGVSRPVAQQLIDTLGVMLPGVTAWTDAVKTAVESGHTQFQAYSGRTIHMPRRAPHAAPNYCIQGTARELLIDALLRWEKTRWGNAVLFPVHDEVVAMVPEDEAEEATAALAECMTTELRGIPIIAEASAPSFAWQDSV